MIVSLSPPSADRGNKRLSRGNKIPQGFPCFAIDDDGSGGNLYDDVVPFFSGFPFSLAAGTIFRFQVTFVAKIVKCSLVGR